MQLDLDLLVPGRVVLYLWTVPGTLPTGSAYMDYEWYTVPGTRYHVCGRIYTVLR